MTQQDYLFPRRDCIHSGTSRTERAYAQARYTNSACAHVADADRNCLTRQRTAIGVSGLSVSSFSSAGSAMDAIQAAIDEVSEQRSYLGALQNRLEHTIANLDNISENTSAAESRIRDVDMAEEMVEYSKNNILAQAGQSMLAQANQSTQGVLSILG